MSFFHKCCDFGRLVRLAVLFFTALGLLSCQQDYRYAPLPQTASVLVLGDSLTYGTGASDGEDYVSLLAARTGWSIINAGVPGNTTSDALERWSVLLADHTSGEQPIDLLIIALGGNDFLKRVPKMQTAANLKTMIAQAKAANIQTVLVAIPELSPIGAAFGTLSDHPIYAQLSQETETPLIENLFSEVLSKNSLKADPIHPNAQGYRFVADQIENRLRDLGFLDLPSDSLAN